MTDRRRAALGFVALMGVVSLFADLCYEGMRSAVGPYLALLGASGTAVGMVAGFGELVGYGLRYVTGTIADRTGRYWAFTIAGYAINLIAVPLLALATSWWVAAMLLVAERLGKAIRNPARSTLLSFAADQVGHGAAFGLHEAMDQIGAILGPLAVAGVLWWAGDDVDGHRWAFAALAVPAVLNLLALVAARSKFADPRQLAPAAPPTVDGMSAPFWWKLGGLCLVGAGLADWALVSFHLQKSGAAAAGLIPILYAAAMGADGVTALVAGRLFDRSRARGGSGTTVVAVAAAVAAAFAPLVFVVGDAAIYPGIVCWAIGLAATESVAKATISSSVAAPRRGRAFGIYYALFGTAWWLGSAATGLLYDASPAAAAAFSAGCLLAGATTLAVTSRVRGARS